MEEKLSRDIDSVEPYKEKIKNIIQELSLTLDQVYNADESDLFWCFKKKKNILFCFYKVN